MKLNETEFTFEEFNYLRVIINDSFSFYKDMIENDFFPDLLKGKVYGYKGRGFFIDIGTPQRYHLAEKYFLTKWKK